MNPFHWLRDRRRQEILKTPFPPSWRAILTKSVVHYSFLTAEERVQLQQLVQVFVAEKNFEGCNGLEMTDEIRDLVLIGASSREIKQLAIRSGMTTLRQSAINKLKQGIISIEEVLRCTVKDN